MAFEEWVASMGMDIASLSQEQKDEMRKAHAAMTQPVQAVAEPAPMQAAGQSDLQAAADPVAEMRAKAAAEAQRIANIAAAFAGKYPDLQAAAIAGGIPSIL